MAKPLYFDRAKFAKGYREQFGSLNQQQTNGLGFILDAVEKDPYIERVEWLAYMLATTKLETAHTFQPIHEYGGRAYFIRRYGSQTKVGRGLGNDTQEEGAIYAGRGDVQLTGEDNYERAETALRKFYPELVAEFERRTGRTFDLTVGDQPGDIRDADNAQDPAIAYAIMSFGMRTGMFTGKKLSDYINSTEKDYKNARRIINGLDHWQLIKTAAEKFEIILKASKVSAASMPAPQEEQGELSPALADPQAGQSDPPPILTETTETVEIDEQGDASATIEKKETSFTPDTLTQYIPKMKGVRNWFATLSLGGIASTTWAAFNNLPPWAIFALGMLTMAVVIGFVFIVVKYRSNLFDLVKHVVTVNADPTTNNIELVSQK